MIYFHRIGDSEDLTFDMWRATICTQVVQCLSILTTCIVYLKPFLDSLETGFIQVGDLRRQNVPGFGYRSESGSKSAQGGKSGVSVGSLKPKLSRTQPQNEDIELQENNGTNFRNLGTTAHVESEIHDWDSHSRSHILRTTTLTVE